MTYPEKDYVVCGGLPSRLNEVSSGYLISENLES